MGNTIMRNCLILAAMAGLACSAPQGYSDDTAAPLTDEAYATIQEVFGSSASEKQVDNGGYSNNAPLTADNSNVDVLVQVIKEADSQYPSDYTPDTAPLVEETKATVEVDGTFENCAVLHEKPVEQEAGYSGEPETVNLYQCGGSLIAPGVLLTAAHCVDKFRQNPTELKIRCGEWDTQHQTEPYPHQDRQVSNLAIHPEFDGRNLQNDFAVLFVSEDFILDQHLDTACLPDANEIFDSTTCFATGWGKDQFGAAGQYQVVLKEIGLPVVNQAVCQDKLRTTRLGQKYKLHDSFLCAGGVAGKDTCKGDGGSPLVCPSKYDPNTYVQADIVAWGIGCGENGVPGVYADVSKATCWIDLQISCHQGASTGNYNSYFGYTSNVCGAWFDNKISGLTQKRDAAGSNQRFRAIFQNMIDQYSTCNVNWEQPTAPLTDVVDVSGFERDGYTAEVQEPKAAEQVEASE